MANTIVLELQGRTALDDAVEEAQYDPDRAPVDPDRVCEMSDKFLHYGKYLRIQIDLDAGTATVVPC